MADLPQSLELDPAQGQGLPDAAIRPTDLGFGQATQAIESTSYLATRALMEKARAQREADTRSVATPIANMQAANEADFRETFADPTKAASDGVVGDLSDRINQRIERTAGMEGLTPGQQSAIRTLGAQHATTVLNAATVEHGKYLAQPFVENFEAAQNAKSAAGLQAYSDDMGAREAHLKSNYVVGDPSLGVAMLGAAKDAQAKALQGLDPMTAADVNLAISKEFPQLIARTEDFVVQHGNTALLRTAADNNAAINNGLYNNPNTLQFAIDNTIPKMLGGMDRGTAKDNEESVYRGAVTSAVHGLLYGKGDPDNAAEVAKSHQDMLGDGYQPLMDEITREKMSRTPRTPEQAAAQAQQASAADMHTVEIQTGQAAGPDTDISALSAPEAAKKRQDWATAGAMAAGRGALSGMTNAELAGVKTKPAPNFADFHGDTGAYATASATDLAEKAGVDAEMAARADGARWAMGDEKGGVKSGAGIAGSRGSVVRNTFTAWTAPGQKTPEQYGQQGASYATASLSAQQVAGIANPRVLPTYFAKNLAESVEFAPPDQRLAALQHLAITLNSVPLSTRLADGSMAEPRAMVTRELHAAGLGEANLSAITDFGDDKGRLGKWVSAMNNPQAMKPLPDKNDERAIEGSVRRYMAPEFKATQLLSGGLTTFNQARYDRTLGIAKDIFLNGSAHDPDAAAKAAAADLAPGWSYNADGWRMPTAQAGGFGFSKGVIGSGMDAVAMGASVVRGELAKGDSDKGFPNLNPGTVKKDSTWAASVRSGTWVNTPDGSGLTLMTRGPDGGGQPVHDKYANTQSYSWSQLEDIGRGFQQPQFNPPPHAFVPPTPQHPNPAVSPMPGFSRQSMSKALSYAIGRTEWSGRGPAPDSYAGAVGSRQMTQPFVNTYAPRLGMPTDLDHYRASAADSEKLSDYGLAQISNKYGSQAGASGMLLTALEYFEGPTETGNLMARYGDPRRPGTDLTGWINGLDKAPKGRNYLVKVFHHAADYLRGQPNG
ncbi:MAG TPA: hypothetical protein VGF33_09935 [Caulobacteraceae bacterium]|jgi:hypothetical protein